MKSISSAKLLLLQPSIPKTVGGGGGGAIGYESPRSILGTHHRLMLIAFLSLLTFASLLTLLTSTTMKQPKPSFSSSISNPLHLPTHLFDTLLHYASSSSKAIGGMPDPDLRAIAAVLRRRSPCNLLVFGLGHETPLWRSLNHGGRTVFVDENQYYISFLEERHPGLEAYDVAYTTKVTELRDLVTAARDQINGACRPVQNLLFSECRLAINDLPNQLYDVAWDVILVDGPRGHDPTTPGRMSAIFTTAVMARNAAARGGGASTEVMVHDYEREVERVCSEEFLCGENLVGSTANLAHFVIRGNSRNGEGFCVNRTDTGGDQKM